MPPIFFEGLRSLKKRIFNSHVTPVSSGTYILSSGQTYYSGKDVGELWEEMGRLQFDFIKKQGLKPESRFLDIGCGSLRGGVHFIRYLNSGNYFGIDRSRYLLDAAREIEIPRYNLSDKTIHLLERDDFDFSVFGVKFDFAIAQSVFSHLTWNSILRCLINVERVLEKNGKFYATFFEDENGKYRISNMTHDPGGVITYPDKDPFHYEFEVFVDIAKRISLQVKYIGDWEHPRNQKMMVFKKS